MAEAWLVLTLTHSGVAVGATFAFRFLPVFLFGLWGGVIADRFDRRTVLLVTNAIAAVLAEVSSTRVTMLVIDHDVSFISRISDRLMVMNYGRLLAEGIMDVRPLGGEEGLPELCQQQVRKATPYLLETDLQS